MVNVSFLFLCRGSRRTDKALEAAGRLLSEGDSSRQKFVFVLTGDRQSNASDVKPFDVSVQPLNRLGAKTYVVAVGDNADSKDEEDTVPVPSFPDLANYVDFISRKVMAAYGGCLFRCIYDFIVVFSGYIFFKLNDGQTA